MWIAWEDALKRLPKPYQWPIDSLSQHDTLLQNTGGRLVTHCCVTLDEVSANLWPSGRKPYGPGGLAMLSSLTLISTTGHRTLSPSVQNASSPQTDKIFVYICFFSPFFSSVNVHSRSDLPSDLFFLWFKFWILLKLFCEMRMDNISQSALEHCTNPAHCKITL